MDEIQLKRLNRFKSKTIVLSVILFIGMIYNYFLYNDENLNTVFGRLISIVLSIFPMIIYMVLFIKFKYYYYKLENRKQFDITLFVYASIFLLVYINSYTILDLLLSYDVDLADLNLYDDFIYFQGLYIILFISIFKDCRLVIKKDIINYFLIIFDIILFVIWIIFQRNIYEYSIILLRLFYLIIYNNVFIILFRFNYKNKEEKKSNE